MQDVISDHRAGQGSREPVSDCDESEMEAPSFALLYDRYFTFVWSMARYFGVDSAEIADVVQDVFVVVYHQLGNLRQPSAIRSWLYTIVKRTSCAYIRSRRALVESNGTGRSEPEVEQVEWVTPQRALENAEQLELLHTLLDKLDAPKREVIILADLEEMSMPSIARMTGVPINTLYSRLRTSRIELEEAFHRHQAKSSLRTGTAL